MKPLNAKQQELLDAMRDKGVTCLYVNHVSSRFPNPFYFRTDTGIRCTSTAKSLLDRKLVKQINCNAYGDYSLAFKEVA